MSGYIYILKFSKSKKYYVGSTDNLKRRLVQHKNGNTPSTRSLGDFNLVFSQELLSLHVARQVENRIKSWKSRDFIEKIIRDGHLKIV